MGVDVAHGDLHRRLELANPGAEARHQQRVGGIFCEEIPIDRDLIEAKHVRQRVAKRLLALRLRRDMSAAETQTLGLRRGQLFSVGLVADQRWNERQLLEKRRRHVARQSRAHQRHDRRPVGSAGAVPDRVIGDELRRAGLGFESRRHDLRDLRDLEQNRLDLRQLDAVAPELDLGVDAAEIFDLALVGDASQIARPINTARRIVRQGKEIVDELGARQFGPVEIALRDTDSGDADFADLAEVQRDIVLGVENDDRIGRQRARRSSPACRASSLRASR